MADEDNSTGHPADESNEAATGDETPDSSSPDSGTSVDSTTPDSSVDESSTLESAASETSASETSTTSDGGKGSDGYASDSTSGPAGSSASTIEVDTPRAETATDTRSTLSESSARVMAAASPSEEATLRRVRAVSKLLDEAFRIPGTNYRIGIDPILGILPVAGDAIPTVLSFYPIVEAYRVGVPNTMLAKMAALVGIDAVVGSIPVIGTLFDAVWKANKWNLRMLERHIEERSSGN